MLGSLYYFLALLFFCRAMQQLTVLAEGPPLFRIFGSVALANYFAAWLGFCVYLVCGMNVSALALATTMVLGANLWLWRRSATPVPCENAPSLTVSTVLQAIRGRLWLITFVLLFVFPFLVGVSVHENGGLSIHFNFVDTAGHLSIARSFLGAARFPPLDLDIAGKPLNYHFLSDFLLAFISQDGLTPERVLVELNILGAFVTAVVLWESISKWLRPAPSLSIAISCALFCFAIPILPNFLHFAVLAPPSDGTSWSSRLLYPFFNFEHTLQNLFEPQRSFLFSFPVILLILTGLIDLWSAWRPAKAIELIWLIALLPFAHATSFLVLGVCGAAVLARHWKDWGRLWPAVALPLVVALAQLAYIKLCCPGFTPQYSGWDVGERLSSQEIAWIPHLFRRAVFWILVDGDFLVTGLIAAGVLLLRRQRPENRAYTRSAFLPLLAIFVSFFLLINFYRFSRNWGDSNKFVLFLNLWIAVLVGHQFSSFARDWRAKCAAIFVLVWILAPHLFNVVAHLRRDRVLFSGEDALAATWIKGHTEPAEVFVTCTSKPMNLVTALAGRTTLHGIFAYNHPYYEEEIANGIRRLYEYVDWKVLENHPARYILVGPQERAMYRISPVFDDEIGLVFSSSTASTSPVEIYDLDVLRRALR